MKKNSKIWDFFLLNVGTFLVAIGVYFFKFPNNFTTGGVSGISVVLGHYIPNMSASTLMFVINTTLLLIGFLFFGKGFGVKTVYSSLMLSGFTWIFERICPMAAPMTSQPLLELVYAVVFPAVGSAILFNISASSGGTDIVAMLLKKYTNFPIGRALLCVDCLVAVSACFAFGMETGLYSITGLLLKGFMVDMVMDNLHTFKYLSITTTHSDEICEYIIKTLHHSATVMDGEGAYSHAKEKMIVTVVTRQQAIQLRAYVRSIDPKSFIVITTSSEIIGKGFIGLSE